MAEFSSLNGYMVKDTTARNIAKGRNQAVAFSDYATMIETLNTTEKDEYRMGQNFYVGVVGVPDLWVYSVEDIVHNFNYISDEDVVEKLTNNTTIQAGYFKLAMLEGQKVDLTTYDQKLAEHDDDIESLDKKIADNTKTLNQTITNVNTIDNSVTTINNSLTNESKETFNFGVKDGVRGFFTNPSRADDSFVPFRKSITPSNFFVNGAFGNGAMYLKIHLTTFSIQNNAIKVVGSPGQSGVYFLFDLDGTYKTLKYRGSCDLSTQWNLIDCKNDSTVKTWSGTSINISHDISQLKGIYALYDGCGNNERSGYIYEIQLLK